jgi:hypothetical protein
MHELMDGCVVCLVRQLGLSCFGEDGGITFLGLLWRLKTVF